MLIPIDWLKEYVAVGDDIQEYCDKMIMSGSNLETVEYLNKNIEKVVIGKVVEVKKHPDADKLKICMIDVGDEDLLQIVTGANNVKENALVVVALHGSKIPGQPNGEADSKDGIKIKKGKLRGVESFGMLCSMGELGFKDKVIPQEQKDGIWILKGDYKLGESIVDALNLKDPVIDFEITPNRPDCLSILGMARETAVTFKGELKYPEIKAKKERKPSKRKVDIKIEDGEFCSRYIAAVVENVKVKPSPVWLQLRLMAAGIRPINNIVDITNYVMTELGQPMHAFDLDKISGDEIIVKPAEKSKKVVTLDGTERKVSKGTLLIEDGEKPVAIAGVMGLENSEVSEDTVNILLESANFSGVSVRNTSKELALRTEASSKFEKGLDPELCIMAIDRVARLIEELEAGEVSEEIRVNIAKEFDVKEIEIRPDRINKLLGVEVSEKDMIDIFERLEIKVEKAGEKFKVTPPTHRLDLEIEEDYLEEIARFYGYDNLPNTLPKGNKMSKKNKNQTIRDGVKDFLCGLGANEIQTYSFCSQKSFTKVNIDEDSWEHGTVKIENPLGEETGVLRTVLTPNMLEVLATNYKKNVPKARAYEIGNTFMPDYTDLTIPPFESENLSIGLYGEDEDFFTLKGIFVDLIEHLGFKDFKFEPESEYGVYHPGRCARIVWNDRDIAIFGEIHPKVAENYGIGTKCYCGEMFLGDILQFVDRSFKYEPLPKYPSIVRDIALLVDENISAGEIESTILKGEYKILESVELFDIYRGKQVADGKKSMAYKLVYRSLENTLTDEEVQKVHKVILNELENNLGVSLREM